MRGKSITMLLLVTVTTAWMSAAIAGPYSGPTGDPKNPYDPGIPGFVGPLGDGKVGQGNFVNPIFVGWATGYVDYLPSDTAWTFDWANPAKALGPVTGNNFDIVSLGDQDATELAQGKPAGNITLTFDPAITDGPGPDFAVFENGFIQAGTTKIFAELGYVDVSTDGINFARFPSDSRTPARVGAYGVVDATHVYNLVGKHVNAYGNSWGTPFDLGCLAADPLVVKGLIDLSDIRYVRIVDIPGSGNFLDASGHPIYDAWVTWGSGGLDLEAVGVIHQR